MIKSVRRRRMPSQQRQARRVNFDDRNLRIERSKISNVRETRTVILHRNMHGFMVMALDDQSRLLGSWSTIADKAKLSIGGCRALDPSKLQKLVNEQLCPLDVWSNDVSMLFDGARPTYRVHAYENKSLASVCADVAVAPRTIKKTTPTPSYGSVRALDPTISRRDYERIYG